MKQDDFVTHPLQRLHMSEKTCGIPEIDLIGAECNKYAHGKVFF
jgi:hypothetical protein